jgi:phytanoyl-CoA hydroxylase
MHLVTPEQKQFYDDHGYLHLRGVLPPAALALARTVLERWVAALVAKWQAEGRLTDPLADLPFETRLVHTWNQAGRPAYMRSPRRDLVSQEMFDYLRYPTLVDVAADLLGTEEILAHGVFNARPKLPDQLWTDTPWHQDAQYYRDAQHRHVVSIWAPLVAVTEHNSCLQVAPDRHRGPLFEGAVDETGFLGLSKEDRAQLQGVSIAMEPGDILCFPQLTPHRALPNHSQAVRWSMDLRFESAENPTTSGRTKGFVARSQHGVTSYEEWLTVWAASPAGSY